MKSGRLYQSRSENNPAAPTHSRRAWMRLVPLWLAAVMPNRLLGNPAGMTVVSGTASSQTSGTQLNVTVGQAAFLNWSSFNIQKGETTSFIQPAQNSVVINNIGGASPSQIWGNLNANGTVILQNADGFYFGPNSMIKVGGSFIATTAAASPGFGGDGAWQFTGPPPLASIVNYGRLEVGQGQSLYLIAERIKNHGDIAAPGGDIGLYAGQEVLLSERPDGRGFSAAVTLPKGSVSNDGKLIADAGTIALQARVVNQNGIIQADSVQEQNGVVDLIASDQISLGANSAISVRGDSQGASSGGNVTIKSDGSFTDKSGSAINIIGGAQGGNGGQLEISAATLDSINSVIDGHAASGFQGGSLIIDPSDLNLTAALVKSLTPSLTGGLYQISLQASDDITLSTVWSLADPGGAALLSLTAGNSIILNNGSAINAGNNWSLSLSAGPATPAGRPASGTDGIYLNGNSYLRTKNGAITLVAAGDVEVASGYINTLNGGNISVQSILGDVNAGVNNNGYQISVSGLTIPPASASDPTPQVGGISTVAGGNVSIEAGNNVISIPNATAKSSGIIPGATGAYGAGDVTVIAGNEIVGNFLVSNGTGLLESGVVVQKNPVTGLYSATINPNQTSADIGGSINGNSLNLNPVTLSLISGSWNVFAARNIYVNEVNNPNGTFDYRKLPVSPGAYPGNEDDSGTVTPPPATSAYLFNYAPDAEAAFWAGNSITLGAGTLFRLSGNGGSPPTTPVYPPQLKLESGAGGITLDTSLILAPSDQGSLDIVTHDGGNLNGVYIPSIFSGPILTMSDSGLPGYSTFATGHAVTPLHLNDPNPNPVYLNISGSINTISMVVPAAATITAASSYNFGFTGQNLSPSALTRINIAGDITYRSVLTSVNLGDYGAAPLPASLFNNALSADPYVSSRLFYDPTTGELTYIGVINLKTDLLFLLNPTIYVLDAGGNQVLDSNGNPETVPVTLTSQQQNAINALAVASQTAVADISGSGITLNGPGRLSITANNMDLGSSSGIQINKALSPQLTGISTQGASLDITLTGDLEMTSTRIANTGWLGAITIDAAGEVDVGTQASVQDPNDSRGIYTSGGGDVSITATGNVNVQGSRIAAFNGGNLAVVSRNGDVNAGSGGNGEVDLSTVPELGADGSLENLTSLPLYYDEQLSAIPIYGSGLQATTVAGSLAVVGNITVQTPRGSINADVGGIEQIAFNGNTTPGNFIELDAGRDISAGNSGVIGSNIRTTAGGNISGIFVGSGAISVNAAGSFSGTIVGATTVSVNAGGTVSGTIVGGENVSVSGSTITASLESGSVSTSGDATSAAVGLPKSNVTQETTKVAEDASTAALGKLGADETNDKRKADGRKPRLTKSTGRVTVL